MNDQERVVWAAAFALAADKRRHGGEFCGLGVARRHCVEAANAAVQLLRGDAVEVEEDPEVPPGMVVLRKTVNGAVAIGHARPAE